MSQSKRLYELQELEREIEEKEAALKEVSARLGSRDALIRAQGFVEQAQGNLDRLRKQLHEQEWKVEDLGAKIRGHEDRLYSGRIGNPKELSGLQHELEILKSQCSQAEDKALEVMGSIDEASAALAARRQELAETERQWQAEQSQLQARQSELDQALTLLKQRQCSLAQQIEPAILSLYQNLRLSKQGRGVVRVEHGMCQGCRISLPTYVLQEARQRVVQCTSCGRILCL